MTTPDNEEDILFIGPGFTNDEIDQLFTDLYQRLLQYIACIFDVVEKLCPSGEDQIRLALNIAETAGNLLPCLVAIEFEKRKPLMKIAEEAKERFQPIPKKPVPMQQIMESIQVEQVSFEEKDQG